MDKLKPPSLKAGSHLLLLENSLYAIPFNVLIAALLALDLFYNGAPIPLILCWFTALIIISAIRLFCSKSTLRTKRYLSQSYSSAFLFLTLTFITGCIWGLTYLIFLPYLNSVHEVIIILVLGGMAAGGVASLSAFLPACYVYILPMFLPVIIYNYSFLQTERSILATMFLLFVVMVLVIAKINSNLLHKIFQLNYQKDSLINQLSVSNKKLEASNEEVRVMSITDELTGLFNRRYFNTSLANELNRAKRNNYPLSLIIIDIDNFKSLNDTFGHPYGDKFLCSVATVLKQSIRRSSEIIVRMGGDEFAVIAANMDLEQGKTLCYVIKEEFSKKNEHINITLSMSITCIFPENKENLDTVVSTADKLLYRAKKQGKNITLSQELQPHASG